MAWAAQGVRCVFYASPTVPPPNVDELWKHLVAGSDPENLQRPRGVPQATASGHEDGLQVAMSTQPGRTDIFISNPEDLFQGSGTDPAQLVAKARDKMMTALTHYRTTRVALVLDLLTVADTPEQARDVLLRELPFLKLPAGATDAVFQLNVVRPFAIDKKLSMNRLCKWSLALLQVLSFTMNVGAAAAMPVVASPSPVERRHAILYQVDLSSPPQAGSAGLLDPGKARSLFGELCDEALSLIEKGYAGLI
jgi:hypothetical protein